MAVAGSVCDMHRHEVVAGAHSYLSGEMVEVVSE